MSNQSSVITRKGQVTIPAEVRKALGIREGDRVEFVLEEREVRLIPRGSVAERTRGALKSTAPPLTAEELRRLAEEVIAEDVIRRSGI